MPPFEFSTEHQAFVKKCSACAEVFIGVRSQEQSEIIFNKYFHPGRFDRNADGFQSRCKRCRSRRVNLGITHQDVLKLLARQGNKCAICSNEITAELNADYGLRACVDHDAATQVVRGLLCDPCNRGIGFLRHDLSILKAAIHYLDRMPLVLKEVG